MVFVLSIVGIVLLILGANSLVDGASSLARRLGISQLVIGLTIVALGTSMPELAVSVTSAHQGKGDLAVGNVVGSNVCNILLILGLTGLITPLRITPGLIRLDIPIMIITALTLVLLGADGRIGTHDAIGLLVAAIAYIVFSVVRSRGHGMPAMPEVRSKRFSLTRSLGKVVLGLVLLVWGSNWMVEGASALARHLGMSELVIGLTVVAVGTSLPETATSIAAALRGNSGIAAGNVVGSNILNVLVILPASAFAAGPDRLTVSEVVWRLDGPVMLAASIACLLLCWSGHAVARLEALILLSGYLLYTSWCLTGACSFLTRRGIGAAAACYAVASLIMIVFLFIYHRLAPRAPSAS